MAVSFAFLNNILWLLCLLLCLFLREAQGLAPKGTCQRTIGTQQSHSSNSEKIALSRKAFLESISFVAQLGLLVGSLPTTASAEDNISLETELRQSLTAPSEDQPRIAFPSSLLQPEEAKTGAGLSSNRKREISPIFPSPSTVQVLLSLKNSQLRPAPNDLLVVQVFDRDPSLGKSYDRGLDFNANESDSSSPLKKPVLLGGAKIPVARIRFPINLQLTSKNAAPSASDNGRPDTARWDTLATTRDLWIVASVCPESSGENLQRDCLSSKKYSFQAAGISKLLQQLPIMATETGDDGVGSTQTMSLLGAGIRAPSSLSLEVVKP